ncbi:mechanosensitive ion channel family protein, partial [bacterium]|nr:mechanosensitive ion channel family protein [bacterium]
MEALSKYMMLPQDVTNKILLSVMIMLALSLVKFLVGFLIKRRVTDVKKLYVCRQTNLYVYTLFLTLFVGRIWIEGIDSLTTILGLASAGVAIAMHDTIANMTGWVFIVSRRPFKVGDRIQIGDLAGDVIDIRFFQFSIVEIGNWVDADQSTGRIVHVPNSKVLREALANYQIGFEYIWNEIPVLIT